MQCSLHLQAVNSVSVARKNWSYKNYLYLFHKLYLMFCILECGLNSECFPYVTEFHIVVCGLDSIVARRWINGMLVRSRSLFK